MSTRKGIVCREKGKKTRCYRHHHILRFFFLLLLLFICRAAVFPFLQHFLTSVNISNLQVTTYIFFTKKRITTYIVQVCGLLTKEDILNQIVLIAFSVFFSSLYIISTNCCYFTISFLLIV
jgi:hypothetical protein